LRLEKERGKEEGSGKGMNRKGQEKTLPLPKQISDYGLGQQLSG